jgi:hypothetical protein
MSVPDAELKIQLQKNHTLNDIEAMIRRLSTSKARSLDVWLPTYLGAQLFKDTLIVGLLAFAANRGIRTRVVDWIANPDDSHLDERFGTTLEGLASLEYAEEIVDSQKHSVRSRVYKHRRGVVEKDGVKTPEVTGGKSLTFCAFDPEMPIPIGFASIGSRAAFVRTFLDIRRDFFEIGVDQRFSRQVDDAVAGFAYELWQNGFQHGRLNESHFAIKGMRYLRVRKHVGYDRNEFIERGDGFPELQSYLDHTIPMSGTFKLYEVTIADNGLGIVERFLSTQPKFRAEVLTIDDHSRFLNRIINEALSSKLNQAGAGHGLEHSLRAVRELRGFVSVRSGLSWLYHAFGDPRCDKLGAQLVDVVHRDHLAPLGTHFSLLYPLKNPVSM